MSADHVSISPRLLAAHLASSPGLCLATTDAAGVVTFANEALERRCGADGLPLQGQSLWAFVVDADAARLRRLLATGSQDPDSRMVNWVDRHQHPFTLWTTAAATARGLALLGEPLPGDPDVAAELVRVNNDMAALAREETRQRRALAAAHAALEAAHRDLRDSHWHLRKLQEVLPICMMCHRVKANGAWDELFRFFEQHSRFLSHGYCPECGARALAQAIGDAD